MKILENLKFLYFCVSYNDKKKRRKWQLRDTCDPADHIAYLVKLSYSVSKLVRLKFRDNTFIGLVFSCVEKSSCKNPEFMIK